MKTAAGTFPLGLMSSLAILAVFAVVNEPDLRAANGTESSVAALARMDGGQSSEPGGGILSEVAVLTIHVSDTNIHDRVFHFLTDVLKLPVDYYPEQAGPRRYAAVYAGNMFIEPCGPYADWRYPVQEFEALFFGLNCNSGKSPAALAAELGRLNIAFEPAGKDGFHIQEASLAEGIYLGLSSKVQDKPAEEREASFRSVLAAGSREDLGFEYVKEVWLGYRESSNLRSWEALLGAARRLDDHLWRLNKNQSLRFVKSELPGVRGIVCRVRSLEQAERYLKQLKCYGALVDGRIELDKAKTFGLSIYLAGE